MAQNFEAPFHVPQQNRRNKLRVLTAHHYHQTNQEHDQTPLPPPTLFSQQTSHLMNPSLSPAFSSLQTRSTSQHGLSLSLSVQLPGGGEMRSRSLPSVPFGPFTGYASILKSSRFLKPAQQILDDLCGVQINSEILDLPIDHNSSLNGSHDQLLMRESTNNIAFGDNNIKYRWKHSKLTFMLDEVYRRYKLYCQQIQSVVASFEPVAGLGNAAPYIYHAIKIVSKHFTCLKNALLDQIQFAGKIFCDDNVTKESNPRFSAPDQGLQINQNPNLNLGFMHNPVWRSQRGLPDHAVAVLKTWLFEHFLHPYPTDSEKQTLALQTGLSRTQVSNWFINARVRLWKPMVEEVHMLESQQAQEAVNQHGKIPSDWPFKKPTPVIEHKNAQNIPTKRSRNELPDVSEKRKEERNIPVVSNLSSHYETPSVSGSNAGVSLALGLQQNDGIDLSCCLPINIAQRVNLEMFSMMDSASAACFKEQTRNFGED